MAAVPERRSVTARALALYSAALGALLVVLAFVAYRELLHYEPRAARHVPAEATLVLRVDLEQLVLFEPIRKHLLALVDRVPLGADGGGSSTAEDAQRGRLARLREEAGLNLGLDLRELVFARLPEGNDWVLVAGGLFPDTDLIERVESVLRAEPGARLRRHGASLLLGSGNLTLARAGDGVLLLGSSPSAIERAFLPGSGHRALGREGAAAFVAVPSHSTDEAGVMQQISGRLDYGDPFALTLDVVQAPGDPTSPRQALERWLHIDTTTFTTSIDWGGERAVLARAELVQASPTLTRVTTTWERAELDRACRSLATWLEAAAARLGPVAQ
jgi:hypothetical protein